MKAAVKHDAAARKTRVALDAFFRLVDFWGLDTQQAMTLLGVTSRSTYMSWKARTPAKLAPDTMERISYLLGTHKALRILFSRDEQSVRDWVKAPNSNPLFGNKSALDRMLSGRVADLYEVRRFLDAQRGGW
ncbi:MAG: MbcA/ParS/Xre antitoxin family protein [Gammaproteobacteria bacterium]|nr:MbcA/ParS/Xre antitoxin family protein [Gammaproteobacteria bacterium]MDH5511699.1 MbcA/ParS/Xre antitoxin family protein [Gammaproteobacteria bacterium]